MLFLSFVLAFVLGILYYTSYPADVIQTVEKPMADTAIVTFVNAHQIAKDMIYRIESFDSGDSSKMPTIRLIYDDGMRALTTTPSDTLSHIFYGLKESGSVPTDASPLGYVSTDLRNNALIKPASDTMRSEDLNKIQSLVARIGLIQRINASTGDVESDHQKLIYDCSNYDDLRVTGCSSAQSENCLCRTTDYVITYVDPNEMSWSANDKITHHELWRSGLLRRTKGSHECGIVYPVAGSSPYPAVSKVAVKYDTNAKYVLDNTQRFTVSLPKQITDQLESDLGQNDLTDYILCITPVKDIIARLERATYKRQKYDILD